MNWSSIESSWNDYKARAGTQWDKLTPQQIDDTRGKRAELSSSIQAAYGLSIPDAEKQISEWQSKQVEKPAPAKS